MFINLIALLVTWSNAQESVATNVFCRAERTGRPVQIFCGDEWSELYFIPQIEGRFEDCSRVFSREVLILRVGETELEIEDPEFPFEITLQDVDLACDVRRR